MIRIEIIGGDDLAAEKIEKTILLIRARKSAVWGNFAELPALSINRMQVLDDAEEMASYLILVGEDLRKDFALAEQIWERSPSQPLIYMARRSEDVFAALPYPFFHVVREFSLEPDLRAVLQKIERIRRPAEKWQTFSGKNQVIRVRQKQILYLESQRHEILVHLEKGASAETGTFVTAETLEKLEHRLKPGGFARIHKSYLVNLDHVVKLEKDKVTLDNGEQLYISRYRYPEVRLQFEGFIRRLDFL